jgi:hypothetical protein
MEAERTDGRCLTGHSPFGATVSARLAAAHKVVLSSFAM